MRIDPYLGLANALPFKIPYSIRFHRIAETLKSNNHSVKVHEDKTVICMEGPQFSTRAESLMYRSWGGDIINMSVLPESKLAREAELSYVLVATGECANGSAYIEIRSSKLVCD